MKFGSLTILTVLILSAIGCGAPYATMQKNGLQYRDYRVEVASISEYKPRFLETNWDIANWMERSTDKTWRRLDTTDYKGNVYVDRYANGDPRKVKKYYSELILDHDGSLSTLTVDVTSASAKEWEMDIDDMYKTFVGNMAAGTPWYTGKRFEKGTVNKQATITIKNYQSFKVMDNDAIIGYVDRSKMDSDAPNADMQFALFMMKLKNVAGINRTESLKGAKEQIPVVVMVVLEAEPNYFNSLLNDFYDLISQIKVNGEQLEVEYVSDTAPPPEEEPCDEEEAEKEGKTCPTPEVRDINEEDIIDPTGGTRKAKPKEEAPKEVDPSGLF